MSLIVSRLCCTGAGTGLEGKALLLREGEELAAHESVLAIGVQGSIDGTSQASRIGEAGDGRWRCIFVVCVGRSNDDVEGRAPLAEVVGLFLGYGCAPDSAL